MTPFVLVHEVWQGGWCWQRVLPLLSSAGRIAYAPTLTGLGERAHLLTQAVDLNTHIQDIVNVLVYEDLWEVVLVGHGYAGMVITGVAERVPERLKHLIYLEAFVPQSAQSLRQILHGAMSAEPLEQDHAWVAAQGDGWSVPPPSLDYFGVTDPRDSRWMAKRLTAHPIACITDSVQIGRPAAAALQKSYIVCTQGHDAFRPCADTARSNPSWRVCDVAAGHSPMTTAPDLLVDALLQLDTQSRDRADTSCLGACGNGKVTTDMKQTQV